MNQFVLAFPLSVAVDEPFAITENVRVLADTKTLMIPGCSVQFNVVRQEASADLLGIFREHCDLTEDEEKAIFAHRSLLFLLGNVKNLEDVRMVNVAISKMFEAKALGVYMQQSGTSWTPDAFYDLLGAGEYPMDPWINFVEAGETLYTLGMATFMLPDLCVATSVENPQQVLLLSADSLFGDGIPAKSGSEIEAEDGDRYVLRAEAKSPFPKDAPEYNKQGVLRLVKK